MIDFCVDKNELLLIYEPDAWNSKRVELTLKAKKELRINNTFFVSSKLIFDDTENIDDKIYVFRIGQIEGEYIKLDREVFSTKYDFYFEKSIRLDRKLFVAYRNISIIKKLDEVLKGDLYVTSNTKNATPNHITISVYRKLLSTFPNSTELTKYAAARISNVLKDYCDGLGNKNSEYESYLNKRQTQLSEIQIVDIKLKLGLFQRAYEELKIMLDKAEGYTEKIWQEKVLEVICLLFPKYIFAKREVDIGSDGRHGKKPDFLLIDSSGFVDVLEIKKPTSQRIMTPTQYRNNYIADREFSGTIVQIEKYLYCLNYGGEKLEKTLKEKLKNQLPHDLTIRINNPQGMLLMGRSDEMTQEQLFDFEIIKRQHKNVVDVMTYDDLLNRLANIISVLQK